jgi:hypothetical protein
MIQETIINLKLESHYSSSKDVSVILAYNNAFYVMNVNIKRFRLLLLYIRTFPKVSYKLKRASIRAALSNLMF